MQITKSTRAFFLKNDEKYPVSVFDEMFNPPVHFIYEVFRIVDGKPLFIEDHLERLWKTALLSKSDLGIDQKQMLSQIYRVIELNPSGDGNMEIAFYVYAPGRPKLFVFYTPHFYPSQEQFKNGIALNLLFAERKNPNAKVMDTGLRKAADLLRQSEEAYEVLLVDREGFVTEGSRSNVFFIRGEHLITPPENMVLKGVTRKHILDICKENNLRVEAEKVHYTKLNSMDALFVTGTSRQVLPVKRVDQMTFEVNHPLLARLQDLFREKVTAYLKTIKTF